MNKNLVNNQAVPIVHIIDDDVSQLMLLKEMLDEKGWTVMTNSNPDAAVHPYYDLLPDCLIFDIKLLENKGMELFEGIMRHTEQYFIPKIMMSSQNDKTTRIKAYQLGADDFIVKPVDMEELVVKIERHVQRKKTIEQSILIDSLTQAYNHKFLEINLSRLFQDYKRTMQTFSIAVLDLDDFKRVNEIYGYAIGDQVLKEFVSYIQRCIRRSDYLFRIGGAKFVCVFQRATDEEAKAKLHLLIQGFSEKTFIEQGKTFSVTFSAGVVMVNNTDMSEEDALKQAEFALDEAKRNGCARVETLLTMRKKKLFISIIDDDAVIRMMLHQTLQTFTIDSFDITIQVFASGLDFMNSDWENVNTHHLLILDGIMPVMDGMEVLQKVKQGKYANRFMVLMLTSRKSKDDIARALQLGADEYITKPFSITVLQARIERILKRVK